MSSITISSQILPNIRWGGSSATLRIYASTPGREGFTTSGGHFITNGLVGSASVYKTVTCPLSSTTLTIPAFQIDSTTDSPDVPTARYTAVFYDSRGHRRDTYLANFAVPTEYGAAVTWLQLRTLRATTRRSFLHPTFATADQVGTLISEAFDALADPFVIDANDAPYSVTPGNEIDQAEAIEATILAAFNLSVANDGACVAVEFSQGIYHLSRELQQDSPYNTQIRIPVSPANGAQPVVELRVKGHVGHGATIYATATGGVVFNSTLTGKAYSSAGVPSIIGAASSLTARRPLGSQTYMTLRLKGINFRQPPNPCLQCYDFGYVERVLIEDMRCDTTESHEGDFSVPLTQPTHPTGGGGLGPVDVISDMFIMRGDIVVQGYYAGPPASELLDQTGYVLSLENWVGFNVQAAHIPWHYSARYGKAHAGWCHVAIGSVDFVAGLAPALGNVFTNRTLISFDHLTIEDGSSVYAADWRNMLTHVYDPNNTLGGVVNFHLGLTSIGTVAGPLDAVGAEKLQLNNLMRVPDSRPMGTDTFTAANGTALVGRNLDFVYPASSAWVKNANAGYSGFEIQSNRAIGLGVTNGIYFESFHRNGRALLTFQIPGGATTNRAGHLLRYVDANNYFVLEWDASVNVVRGIEVVAGVATTGPSASQALALGSDHTLEVDLQGPSISWRFNGGRWTHYTLSSGAQAAGLAAATKHGPYTVGTSAQIDSYSFTTEPR